MDPMFYLFSPAAIISEFGAAECHQDSHTNKVSQTALQHLLSDEPGKRRKVYMEFATSKSQQFLLELDQAGFDMTTVRHIRRIQARLNAKNKGYSCLVTGSSETILSFLQKNEALSLASVDLPEYSWLSSSPENATFCHLPSAKGSLGLSLCQ